MPDMFMFSQTVTNINVLLYIVRYSELSQILMYFCILSDSVFTNYLKCKENCSYIHVCDI